MSILFYYQSYLIILVLKVKAIKITVCLRYNALVLDQKRAF